MVADLVMSLDNVLAVAAVAKGDMVLLVLGLLISVPLIAFGATMLTRLMQRYPLIITGGVALIGYVAADLLVTDPVVIRSFGTQVRMMDMQLSSVFHQGELSAWGLAGAAFVVTARGWLRKRQRPDRT
jgi:predicted tellurium resistance membrane protein TerC